MIGTKSVRVVLFVFLLVSSAFADCSKCARKEQKDESSSTWKTVATTFGLIGGGAAAVIGAPFVLSGLGFTAAGVAAGSVAAKAMALAGGKVAAGGVIAGLQSAGAAGIGAVGNSILAAAGAATGGWIGSSTTDEDCQCP